VVISPAITTSSGCQSFCRDTAVWILLQAGVENSVGDLVGNFVGWPSVTDSEVNKKRSLKIQTPFRSEFNLVAVAGCSARLFDLV